MSTEEHNPNEWKAILAVGLAFMLFLLGIGGCLRLAGQDGNVPIISITTKP